MSLWSVLTRVSGVAEKGNGNLFYFTSRAAADAKTSIIRHQHIAMRMLKYSIRWRPSIWREGHIAFAIAEVVLEAYHQFFCKQYSFLNMPWPDEKALSPPPPFEISHFLEGVVI